MAAGPAMYAIRPEHMRLAHAPEPNALPVRVLAETFRGEQYEYLLQAGDEAIRVHACQPSAAPTYVVLPAEYLFPVCDDAAAPPTRSA